MSRCTVYRSSLKAYTYVYLREDLEPEDLPEELLKLLGEPEAVMELDLGSRRSLANANIETVMARLEDPGYHLQMPPEEDPSGWLDLPPKKD